MDRATQTMTKWKAVEGIKRSREGKEDIGVKLTTSKKCKSSKDPAVGGVQGINFEPSFQMKPQKMAANVWATVMPSPDAIVLKSRDDRSYAEILHKVNVDPTLSGLADNVTRIRTAQKEILFLELRKTQDERTLY